MLAVKQFAQTLSSLRRGRIEVTIRGLPKRRGACGREWEGVVEIADDGRSVFAAPHGDFAGRERLAVRSAEYRQSDFAVQVGIVCRPVDVKVFRKAAVAPARQHIHPPSIVATNRHVVGDDVDDYPEPISARFLDQPPEGFFTAEFRIDASRINNVIAVHRTGARCQNRREVKM
jgi:hypothetical protein